MAMAFESDRFTVQNCQKKVKVCLPASFGFPFLAFSIFCWIKEWKAKCWIEGRRHSRKAV